MDQAQQRARSPHWPMLAQARCVTPPSTPHRQEAHSNRPVLFTNCHRDQVRVRGTLEWEWSWSNVHKPDTRFPPASRLIARALDAVRCSSRARIARSAAAIIHGLRGRPGSTSRAPGVTAQAPKCNSSVIDRNRCRSGGDRDGGDHGADANVG